MATPRKPLMFRVQTTGWDHFLWLFLPLRWNVERLVKLLTYSTTLPINVPVLLDVNGHCYFAEWWAWLDAGQRRHLENTTLRLDPAEERAARNFIAGNPVTDEERALIDALLVDEFADD